MTHLIWSGWGGEHWTCWGSQKSLCWVATTVQPKQYWLQLSNKLPEQSSHYYIIDIIDHQVLGKNTHLIQCYKKEIWIHVKRSFFFFIVLLKCHIHVQNVFCANRVVKEVSREHVILKQYHLGCKILKPRCKHSQYCIAIQFSQRVIPMWNC